MRELKKLPLPIWAPFEVFSGLIKSLLFVLILIRTKDWINNNKYNKISKINNYPHHNNLLYSINIII